MLLLFGLLIMKSPNLFRIIENSHLGGTLALGN
jgi:hypothetical protein